jgi:2-methylisocitrate lyase-like PEP mutase family enzyme
MEADVSQDDGAFRNQQAEALRSLHHSDRLLVLPNIWNPVGARMLESKGFPAVATASAAIAESLGYRDGERIRFDTMLDTVGRIARAVLVPVTADFEAGYAEAIPQLQENTGRILDAGAVGINFEDSLDDGARLRPIPQQVERIAAVREAALRRGIPLVINARADSFIAESPSSDEERLEDAILRCEAYARAGADCVYPIGRGDKATLATLRRRLRAPINVLATASTASLVELQQLGINRVSFGPFIFRSLLSKMSGIFDALLAMKGYGVVTDDMLTSRDTQAFLPPGKEA